jgi:hypothetical protein
VLWLEPKAKLITLTETYQIYITKTEFNYCSIIHCIFINSSTNNDLSNKTTFGSQKSSENDLKYHNNSIKILEISFGNIYLINRSCWFFSCFYSCIYHPHPIPRIVYLCIIMWINIHIWVNIWEIFWHFSIRWHKSRLSRCLSYLIRGWGGFPTKFCLFRLLWTTIFWVFLHLFS